MQIHILFNDAQFCRILFRWVQFKGAMVPL